MASTMEVKVEFLTRVLEDVEAGLANSSQEIEDLRAKVACLRRIVGALDQQRVMFEIPSEKTDSLNLLRGPCCTFCH